MHADMWQAIGSNPSQPLTCTILVFKAFMLQSGLFEFRYV